MKRAALIALGLCGALGCRMKDSAPAPAAIDVSKLPSPTGHPRLWLRANDVTRLRGWATKSNPLWPALANLGASARSDMDAGKLTRGPGCTDERGIYPCEEAAELFAFLSLVSPEEKTRQDYGARAHKLLMQLIDTVAHGPADDPLRLPRFAVDDRSRWSGEAIPLTVDWIYPLLSTEEKHTIKDTFVGWCDQLQHAVVTTNNHPEPIDVVDDPRLTADKKRLRWAGNNYFTAHARNMGLMALALDRADDSDGKLSVRLKTATGAWLYMIDHLLREDARGGLPPEGIEYGPQSMSYVAQLLLALHTANMDDATAFGAQSQLDSNPFWKDAVNGWLHLQSPDTIAHPWMGPVHQPAWWGDGQHELTPDAIDLFAPIALYYGDNGSDKEAKSRVEAIRWIQRELPPAKLLERFKRLDQYRQAILYFMLMDPTVPPPRDPRPSLPTAFVAPGIGRLLARSDWTRGASWIDFAAGWISVDHQHADSGSFDFYRNGEWLTKERTGYGPSSGASDWHNTLSIENDQPFHAKRDPTDYRALLWKSGSQWLSGTASGDGKLVAHSEDPHYVYALGDLTALYNSDDEHINDVVSATRTLVWLVPDRVIILDHAVTKTDGRFKRFYLHLPALPKADGRHATMTTARGQHLFITTLLPADATPLAEPAVKSDEPAELDPIHARFTVESRAADVRFLHVLQGADGAAAAEWAQLLESTAQAIVVRAGDVVIVFPAGAPNGGDAVNRVQTANLDVPAPAGVRAVLFTGLAENAGYSVKATADGRVHITKDGPARADSAGVLWWSAH